MNTPPTTPADGSLLVELTGVPAFSWLGMWKAPHPLDLFFRTSA